MFFVTYVELNDVKFVMLGFFMLMGMLASVSSALRNCDLEHVHITSAIQRSGKSLKTIDLNIQVKNYRNKTEAFTNNGRLLNICVGLAIPSVRKQMSWNTSVEMIRPDLGPIGSKPCN
jgi:hypothetical protein